MFGQKSKGSLNVIGAVDQGWLLRLGGNKTMPTNEGQYMYYKKIPMKQLYTIAQIVMLIRHPVENRYIFLALLVTGLISLIN